MKKIINELIDEDLYGKRRINYKGLIVLLLLYLTINYFI